MRARAVLIALALPAFAQAAGYASGPSFGGASAQTPAAAAAPAPASSEDSPATPPPDYSYAIDGRRDPFVSLVNRGTAGVSTQGTSRPDGVAGLLIDELVVHGILRSEGGWIAMVGAPNGKTYTVRPGDRLMDGAVRSITARALILMQDVSDPLSLEKQREVRKYLRGGDQDGITR